MTNVKTINAHTIIPNDYLHADYTPRPDTGETTVSGHLDNMVSVEEKKGKPQTKKEVYINGLVSTRLYH